MWGHHPVRKWLYAVFCMTSEHREPLRDSMGKDLVILRALAQAMAEDFDKCVKAPFASVESANLVL